MRLFPINGQTQIRQTRSRFFGDAYKQNIEGTGTWNNTPKAEWRFTKEQIGEVKEYLDTYGPSNYQTENGLTHFMDTFGTCKVK